MILEPLRYEKYHTILIMSLFSGFEFFTEKYT